MMRSCHFCAIDSLVLDAIGFMFGTGGGALIALLAQILLRPIASWLGLTKTEFDGRSLVRACVNGSSELMSNIAMSVVGMLYNVQLMRYAGECSDHQLSLRRQSS